MLSRLYNILVSCLGESKQGYYDSGLDQYQFNCPNCAEENGGIPDQKFNLEINLKMGKFHCWKCGDMGNISRLVKKHGGTELMRQYLECVKTLKELHYLDPDMFKDSGANTDDECNILELPATYTKINLATLRDKKLIEYLTKRRITQDIIDLYGIGYTNNKEEKPSMRNRIIIPSHDISGDLNYWVGRDFTGNDKRMKYWNSKLDKNSIVFQEDKICWDANIYLCEGVIDAIYYPNSIALMGKSLTQNTKIYQELHERANANIIICLDGDTDISETKRIYRLLNSGRLRGKIRYIRMDKYKDFGEVYEAEGKQGMINVFRTQQEFEEIDLLI